METCCVPQWMIARRVWIHTGVEQPAVKLCRDQKCAYVCVRALDCICEMRVRVLRSDTIQSAQ